MRIICEVKEFEEGKCYWIKSDGHIFEVEPDNGCTFELNELQSAAGGYIEILRPMGYARLKQKLNDYKTRIMVLNEEGKIYAKDLNQIASDLAFDQMAHWDYIAGDVLYIPDDKIE